MAPCCRQRLLVPLAVLLAAVLIVCTGEMQCRTSGRGRWCRVCSDCYWVGWVDLAMGPPVLANTLQQLHGWPFYAAQDVAAPAGTTAGADASTGGADGSSSATACSISGCLQCNPANPQECLACAAGTFGFKYSYDQELSTRPFCLACDGLGCADGGCTDMQVGRHARGPSRGRKQ